MGDRVLPCAWLSFVVTRHIQNVLGDGEVDESKVQKTNIAGSTKPVALRNAPQDMADHHMKAGQRVRANTKYRKAFTKSRARYGRVTGRADTEIVTVRWDDFSEPVRLHVDFLEEVIDEDRSEDFSWPR